MPNPGNVCAPINIHGIGRSGTTLLQNILAATGHVQVCNETAGMVLCCYRGGEVALLSDDSESTLGHAELPAAIVRAALCTTMPSRKPHWCQKLGGIPNQVVWNMTTTADHNYASLPYPFPYEWYWRAVHDAFPSSKDVLILRDYRDVIISRYRHSRWPATDIASDVAVYFNLLAHPMAEFDHVILFQDLVAQPKATVAGMLTALDVESEQDALRAMEYYAVPSDSRDLAEARAVGFTWQGSHNDLVTDEIKRLVAPAVSRLERRLGVQMVR